MEGLIEEGKEVMDEAQPPVLSISSGTRISLATQI
jgi:hypothetical protein